jgi:hypothetical protein
VLILHWASITKADREAKGVEGGSRGVAVSVWDTV